MPQNMQRRPKVTELEVEEEAAVLEAEGDDLPSDETFYTMALKRLEHGFKQKDIADHLVSAGMSRLQARKLAEQVWQENPHTRLTNAYILFAAAGIFTVPGILLLILQVMTEGSLPWITPAYGLFLVGVWFFYKGYMAIREIK